MEDYRFILDSLLYYVIYISYHLLFMPRTKNDYVKGICVDPLLDQYEELKKRSELGIPIAYHVRMAVKEHLAREKLINIYQIHSFLTSCKI